MKCSALLSRPAGCRGAGAGGLVQEWAGRCGTGQCFLVFGQWWDSLLRVEVPHMDQSTLCYEFLVKYSDPP